MSAYTATESALVGLLAQRAGDVVSYDDFAERLWGSRPADQFQRDAIRTYIARIRSKLRADGVTDAITTVRGAGYLGSVALVSFHAPALDEFLGLLRTLSLPEDQLLRLVRSLGSASAATTRHLLAASIRSSIADRLREQEAIRDHVARLTSMLTTLEAKPGNGGRSTEDHLLRLISDLSQHPPPDQSGR